MIQVWMAAETGHMAIKLNSCLHEVTSNLYYSHKYQKTIKNTMLQKYKNYTK